MVGKILAGTVFFIVALVSALLLHLDAPATRHALVTQGNGVLKGLFAGEIHIAKIGHIGFDGVAGVDATIFDPDRVLVLDVRGAAVHANVPRILKSVLFGKGPMMIDVASAEIGNGEANLDTKSDGKGGETMRIVTVFDPKTPQAPEPPTPPGRGVIVEARKVTIGHVWAHGTPPGAIFVDADISKVDAHAHVDPDRVTASLDHLGLASRGMPQHVDPSGDIHATMDLPLANPQAIALEATFAGAVQQMAANVEATMKDQHLAAAAKVVKGEATVDAHATVDLAGPTHIVAKVVARNVNAAELAPGAPKTVAGLDADADVILMGESIDGTAHVDTLPSTVEAEAVPPIAIRGKFEGRQIHAQITVTDPRMPTDISATMIDQKKIVVVAHVKAPDLRQIPRAKDYAAGGAAVDVDGWFSIPDKTFDVTANVAGERLYYPPFSVGRANVRAKATGTVTKPVVEADVAANEVRNGELRLTLVRARAKVEIDASGPTPIIEIHDADAAAERPNAPRVVASARLVRIAGETLEVRDAHVLGAGDAIALDLTKDAHAIRAKVDAPNIDIPLLAKLVGVDGAPTTGTLALKVDGVLEGNEATGKAHAELRNLTMQDIENAHADLDATIDRREIHLDLDADVGVAGRVSVHTTKMVIGGPATDPESWKRVFGRMNLAGEVDLARAISLVPQEKRPVSDLHGILSFYGRVGRDNGGAPPEIQMHAHTVGLAASGPSLAKPPVGGVEVQAVAPWRISGTEIGLDVRNDAPSGLTNVAFHVTDPHGAIVATDIKAVLPYRDLLANPARAKERLLAAPIAARIVVPQRRLDQLPPVLGFNDVRGVADADITLAGTVLEPQLHAVVRSRGVRTLAMPGDVELDGDAVLDYDGQAADLAVKLSSKGQETLAATTHVEAKMRDVLRNANPLPWNADAKVTVAGFPLETLPPLSDRRVRGRVSGDVTIEGIHRDAKVAAKIDLKDLRVGRVRYEKGQIFANAGAGKLDAHFRLEQTDGFVDATAKTGLAWGAALTPTLDPKNPVEARLQAKAFRAAAIQPFVQGVLPSLDGRIDADASAKVVPGKAGAELAGNIVFRDGTVGVAALGDELRNVKATVTLAPDGTIKVTDVSATGTEGEMHADASVKLDGMRIADAQANLSIPEKKAFSMNANGMPIGDVSGIVHAKASQSPDLSTLTVDIDVPKLAVALPQVTKTGVQQLQDKENVRIGVYRDRTRFVELPLDQQDLEPPKKAEAESSHTDVTIKLGRVDVTRGNSAAVALGGDIKIRAGNETKITGQIRALDGWADVQGKKFTVEKATVTFNGDTPPNPVVVATAGWTAADGTRVFADFVGPVKTGKVVLRSEPARPKNEVLALVLFGTVDGANPPPPPGGKGPDGTTRAAGIGGGFAAQGLTEALDDLSGLKATARIDTTEANNPRPELEFQVSPKVSVGFSHVIGTPPITEPDRNLAKGNYRFHRNWSLETTVGDRGKATVDAIWQKRY